MILLSPIGAAVRSILSGPVGPSMGLPGTLYTFGASGLPAPFDALRRTGVDTFIGQDGVLRYNAHNLLPRSDDVSNAAWSKAGTTTTAGSSLLTETTSNSLHNIQQVVTGAAIAGQRISLAFEVRAVGRTTLTARFGWNTGDKGANFDLAAVTRGTLWNSPVSATISDVGDGWRLISITATSNATGDSAVYIGLSDGPALDNNGGPSYAGTLGVGVELRRLRLVHGTDITYVPTTSAALYLPSSPTYNSAGAALGLQVQGLGTNLLPQSEDPSGSAWAGNNVSAADSGQTYRGRKIYTLAKTATNTSGGRYSGSFSTTSGQNYCSIVVLYAGTTDTASIGILASDGWGTPSAVVISGPGTIVTQSNLVRLAGLESTPTVVLYRRQINATSGQLYCYPGTSDSATLGHSVGVVFHNVELGLVPTSYIPNAGTGTVVRTGDFAGGGLSGSSLTALFSSGWTKNTLVIAFRKGYTSATTEAILSLCAGSSYSAGNGAAIRMFNTDLRALGNGSSVLAGNPCVCDGVTLNKVAISWDTSTTTLMISANGSTPVSQSTFDFTGTGTTNLVLGALDTTGTQAMSMFFPEWIRVVPGQHITGSALQALSA